MSAITPEAFMGFFEKTTGTRFVDSRTGRPALEVLQKQKEKSDDDRWLEAQGTLCKTHALARVVHH